jgi:hypothetical protein
LRRVLNCDDPHRGSAELDDVAQTQPAVGLAEGEAVEEGAATAAEVADIPAAARAEDLGVTTADGLVGQDDLEAALATDTEQAIRRPAEAGHPRPGAGQHDVGTAHEAFLLCHNSVITPFVPRVP